MDDPKRLAEATPSYDLAEADLAEPLILKREGQPVAVLLSFQEYRRLRELETGEEQRRQAGWQDLTALLAEVHSRASENTPEQIEDEIAAARAEVKRRHADAGSGY